MSPHRIQCVEAVGTADGWVGCGLSTLLRRMEIEDGKMFRAFRKQFSTTEEEASVLRVYFLVEDDTAVAVCSVVVDAALRQGLYKTVQIKTMDWMNRLGPFAVFFVDPDRRRCGMGRRLVSDVITVCPPSLRWTANGRDKSARAFFSSCFHTQPGPKPTTDDDKKINNKK